MPDESATQLLQLLESFHDETDQAIGKLVTRHGDHLRCRLGCAGCCIDEVTVFDIEAALLRREYQSLLTQGQPHAPGRCAFLAADESCRVYPHRPYVCRSQGLPLRWVETAREGQLVEYRDICAEIEQTIIVTELAADECWTIGPAEATLRSLQQRFGGGLDRKPLRDLFGRA